MKTRGELRFDGPNAGSNADLKCIKENRLDELFYENTLMSRFFVVSENKFRRHSARGLKRTRDTLFHVTMSHKLQFDTMLQVGGEVTFKPYKES